MPRLRTQSQVAGRVQSAPVVLEDVVELQHVVVLDDVVELQHVVVLDDVVELQHVVE